MFEYAATDALTVSFQRFPYPATGIVDALPTSCGALPVFIDGPDRILVASPAGEAMWIALLSSPEAGRMAVHFTASTRSGGRVDVLSGHDIPESVSGPATFVVMPPHRFIRGIPRPGGGWWPLTRHAERSEAPSCLALELMISALPIGAVQAQERPSGDPEAGILRLHIELTDAGNFTRHSGEDIPPLRPDSAYGGWRLP